MLSYMQNYNYALLITMIVQNYHDASVDAEIPL